MDLELSDDQQALQEGVRALLQGRFSIDSVRALEGTSGVDRTMWSALAEAGVFSLVLPEDDGGVGLGYADAAVVFEQLGMFLVPGPVIGSFLSAGLVPGVAQGEVVAGMVAPGAPVYIENYDALDAVVVHRDDGLYLIDPASVTARPVAKPLDPLTPLHEVTDLPPGDQIGDAGAARHAGRAGTLLASSFLLGMAAATTDLAVAYAKERQQFGKPIGSFQAVKHICADMTTRVEVARSAVYAAGVLLDDPEWGDVDRALSVAKLVAGDAAVANGRGCIQVHGGMGYTWEVPAHLYLKRAWVLETVFGDADHHAESVAAAV